MLQRTSVATIMSTFTKTVDKLRAHSNAEMERARTKNDRIHVLQDEVKDHEKEIVLAERVAIKLESLISGDSE